MMSCRLSNASCMNNSISSAIGKPRAALSLLAQCPAQHAELAQMLPKPATAAAIEKV